MRAIVQDAYGGPEVLRLADVDPPAPGVGQVRLRVRAAALDASVWYLLRGRPRVVRLGAGLRRPRVRVPSQELVGVVEAVGPGVRRVSVGDEAFGTGRGAFAELALAAENRLAPLPPGVPAEAAATLGVSGTTALQAVQDAGEVRAGHRVLVTGAGGGVGSFVVALATARGAEVTAVAGPGKADLVTRLGAARTIDYTREPLDAAGAHDVVIDVAGNRPLRVLREVLAPRGILVLVGAGVATTGFLGGAERQLRGALLSPFTRQRIRGMIGISQPDDLQTLAAMVADGRLRPAVERVVALEDVPDAVRELGRGHASGKTVVIPSLVR
ncbi:NAD(P)-dependent alcohol dehydrogenase [Isoptericola sp. BMS4]|uniref:NAD(P)-dependent alcohol dehydrogenase n=1 Tax=Isoptericola sp. BMS4 TaxID=2527875 RepID=UPI0014215CF3|nr:NAD(P)-dependent alcohol dehydrogenase [Isoptericola sp. BMS4]